MITMEDLQPIGNKIDIFAVAPAEDYKPIPPGSYICITDRGEQHISRSGTRGYKIKFVVSEGEHSGHCLWMDLWFTQRAAPYTRRELAKFGIVEQSQLDKPLDRWRCRVKVAIRVGDDNIERNEVRGFDAISKEVVDNPFTPEAAKATPPTPPATPVEIPEPQFISELKAITRKD